MNAAPNAKDRRFETLFEQAPFSLQLLASDGRTLRVNKAWEALWQVSPGDGVKEYVLGEYNVLTDPQLEARGVTPLMRRAFAGESIEVPAVRYDPAEIGKAGRARWVRAFAHPVKDDHGAVCEVLLIHEDVTDRLQAEQDLRGSEMRLKQLANTIPQLAWMADPQGAIHWYNDRWFDYTGATAREMEGWGWQSVHDPKVLPQVLAQWRRSLETGEPFQMTFPLRGRDGRFRPFFTLVAPLKDAAGQVVQWFGTNTDVSALQEAQENLRVAEERLRLAALAGNIGIWEWDVEDDAITWSDQVHALHGTAPGGFQGGARDFSELVHAEDRQMLWGKIESALADNSGFSAEFRALLPEGESRWLSTWARVHQSADGAGRRMIGATISIDEYKRAEEALRESDRRKDEFLAMLAHELRNPLAPISTAAEILRLDPRNTERVDKASEVIGRQVAHIIKLVDDLLDVSRVTRGLIKLDREVVLLSAVIHDAVEQALPLIEAQHHVLTRTIEAPHACVRGDRARLVQIIANLLNNAARYTPKGGRIALSLRSDRDSAVVHVADNGQGIDPALIPHIFDLFTQGARTPDRSLGGLGIGLALVKRLVELHGGGVRAESAGHGHGSEFTVTLPLALDERAESSPRDAAGIRLRARRIMVVDDNRDAAESLAALLEATGHSVEVAYDGEDALASPCVESADLFILDIGLPDMDGFSLARRLRERNANATFVALTGYGQPLDAAQSRAAGFDHHFVKPVDPPTLQRVLLGFPAT